MDQTRMSVVEGPVRETDMDEMAALAATVIAMTRFLSRLSGAAPFKETDLGLAEWLALRVFARNQGASKKVLAKNLDVTGQRAKQICDSLQAAGLISVVSSTVDTRKNEIALTNEGSKRLMELDEKLLALMGGHPNSARAVASIGRTIRRNLVPIVSTAPPAAPG
jgi:DNA-binding MarR family transcriptional regulator